MCDHKYTEAKVPKKVKQVLNRHHYYPEYCIKCKERFYRKMPDFVDYK